MTGRGAGAAFGAEETACADTSFGSDVDAETAEGVCVVALEAGLAGAGRI